jgi:ferritin-like metal-binding protein YciE
VLRGQLPFPSGDRSVDRTLKTLFHETLKDIYCAERKILKALPNMARGASNPDLETAFLAHRQETEGQVERLQKIFEIIGKRAEGKTCDAIEGILAEGEEVLETYKGEPALDAGLVASAQAVERYEIARYGTLKAWATELGMNDVANLLDRTLAEEVAADLLLTELASRNIDHAAIAAE